MQHKKCISPPPPSMVTCQSVGDCGSHSLSPSTHLLYKPHRIFPKVFCTYRFLDIFFVHFLRLLYSFATSTSKNNKNNLTHIPSGLTAFMVSRPGARRKVKKWAQKKAPGCQRQTTPSPTNRLLTATNDLPSVLHKEFPHHACSGHTAISDCVLTR